MTGFSSITVDLALGEHPLSFPHTYFGYLTDVWKTIEITRGKTGSNSQYEMGTATLTLKNEDYALDPDNDAGISSSGPLPMCPIRISATDSSSTRRNLFVGFVHPLNGWTTGFAAHGRSSTVTVNCVDLFYVLNTLKLPPVDVELEPQLYAGWHSGQQIALLVADGLIPIDDTMWTGAAAAAHTAFGTDIPSGQALVQPYVGGMSALAWLQRMADSEGGAFYITKDGKCNFDDRYAPLNSGRMVGSQSTFDSVAGQVSYRDLLKDYATAIYNTVNVTAAGMDTVTRSDSQSITDYTQSDLSLDGLFLNDTAETSARADWYLAAYKDPLSTPSSLTIDARRGNNTLNAALQRELRDMVTVKFQSPGAAAQVTTDVNISRISHSLNASAQSWSTTFGLEPRRYGFTTFNDYLQYDQSQAWDGTRKWGF